MTEQFESAGFMNDDVKILLGLQRSNESLGGAWVPAYAEALRRLGSDEMIRVVESAHKHNRGARTFYTRECLDRSASDP